MTVKRDPNGKSLVIKPIFSQSCHFGSVISQRLRLKIKICCSISRGLSVMLVSGSVVQVKFPEASTALYAFQSPDAKRCLLKMTR
jgi:hypothetical protein